MMSTSAMTGWRGSPHNNPDSPQHGYHSQDGRYTPTANGRYTPTTVNNDSRYTPATVSNDRYTPTTVSNGRFTPTPITNGRYTPSTASNGRYTPTTHNSQYTPTTQSNGKYSATTHDGQRYTPTTQTNGRYTPTISTQSSLDSTTYPYMTSEGPSTSSYPHPPSHQYHPPTTASHATSTYYPAASSSHLPASGHYPASSSSHGSQHPSLSGSQQSSMDSNQQAPINNRQPPSSSHHPVLSNQSLANSTHQPVSSMSLSSISSSSINSSPAFLPPAPPSGVGGIDPSPRLSVDDTNGMGGGDSYSSASYSGGESSHSPHHSHSPHQDTEEVSSGYINDYSELDCGDISLTVPEPVDWPPGISQLPDVESCPWSEQDVLMVLREGRTKHLSGIITVEMMQRVCYVMHRPLLRITAELRRLAAQTYSRIGKHEVTAALRIVLSKQLYDSCIQACSKALALSALAGDSVRRSRASLCGLRFSPGAFRRWLLAPAVRAAPAVTEHGAVCLAAAMENLVEEVVLIALDGQQCGSGVLSVEALEYGIGRSADVWGLLQPYQHLITARNSQGVLSLPSCLQPSADKLKSRSNKSVEQSLLTTHVSSLPQLGTLVTSCMQHWNLRLGNQQPGVGNQQQVDWYPLSLSSEAVHTLYHYMGSEATHNKHKHRLTVSPPPPLCEWIRVCAGHAQYRGSWVVDADDVRQAARIMLPGHDCPPRTTGPDEALSYCVHLDPQKSAVKLQQDLAFRMMTCGRSDLLPHALALLGKNKLSTMTEQGLTGLMYAAIHGDDAMLQLMLDNGADVNQQVPSDVHKYPCIHPETRGWTALTFAAARGHLSTATLLLERGAIVDGPNNEDSERHCETPLQLACCRGDGELVGRLLGGGADPYVTSAPRNGVSFTYNRAGHNAFTLAACHGHKHVLRLLLNHPGSESEVLSLEEMLAEGHTQRRSIIEQNIYEDHKHEYMTIDDALASTHDVSDSSGVSSEHDANTVAGHTPDSRLTRAQYRVLQDTLYHASECGQVDIALELRDMGIPWTVHSWAACLEAGFVSGRRSVMAALLRDFYLCKHEEMNADFITETLPLMVDIFKANKNDPLSLKLASILQSLYGTDPIPPIPEMRAQPPAKIDPRYVNSRELSDVEFMIEGRVFYAHRIILVNASDRFRAMLSSRFTEGQQQSIPLTDVTYHIFEYMMQYLYHGGVRGLHVDNKDVLELLGAANFFMLDGLQRHCEVLASQKLAPDNVANIYKHAKLYAAVELVQYIEAYILQNLPSLLNTSQSVRKLLFSPKRQNYELTAGLVNTLSGKLRDQLASRTRRGVNGVTTGLESVRI